MAPLIFLLVGVAAAALYWWQHQAALNREQQFRAVAAQRNWTYYEDDPFGTLGLDFEIFGRGHDNKVLNVLVGADEQGKELRVFDYVYTTGSGNSREIHWWTCVTLALGGLLPSLSISHDNVLNRMADAVTHHDIQLESEEFNRRFAVHSNDPRFATAFLDPQMMAYLLSADIPDVVGVGTGWLLQTFHRTKPAEFDRLIGACDAIRDHIPSVVWELYPPRT
jgi:hypothetical protein